MNPVVLPFAERMRRLDLRRRGVKSYRVGGAGGRLHVYDAAGTGSLPTTVLLHGLGSAATPFGTVLDELRSHSRRVIAPDYPGHGFSDTRATELTPSVLLGAVTETLNGLLDEPAILVGNSLGGAVALSYAQKHPERVSALVLVSPAGARTTDAEMRDLRAAFDFNSRSDVNAFLERIYHRPPWFLPLIAHELRAVLQRPAVRELLASAGNEDTLTELELSALPMPILLLWGQSEGLLPNRHLDYFTRHLPSHAVIERPYGFGHCPHVDAPRELVSRIVGFARSRERRPGRPSKGDA